MTPSELSLENFIRDLPEFKPYAYYDKHMDAIRVQILDCSTWEDRLDPIMTVCRQNNHPSPDGVNDIVGFVVKGVRHLLHEFEMGDETHAVVIADLLDRIVKAYPTRSTKLAVEFWSDLGASVPPKVELEEAS